MVFSFLKNDFVHSSSQHYTTKSLKNAEYSSWLSQIAISETWMKKHFFNILKKHINIIPSPKAMTLLPQNCFFKNFWSLCLRWIHWSIIFTPKKVHPKFVSSNCYIERYDNKYFVVRYASWERRPEWLMTTNVHLQVIIWKLSQTNVFYKSFGTLLVKGKNYF